MALSFGLLAGFIILMSILLILPLTFHINYSREGDDDVLSLEFILWPGIVRYRYRVVTIDIASSIKKTVMRLQSGPVKDEGVVKTTKKYYEGPGILEGLRQFFLWRDVFGRIKRPLSFLLDRIIVKRIEWKTWFGLGDPYFTGLASGLAWSVKGYIASLLCRRLKVEKKPFFSVCPDFNSSGLVIFMDCIFVTRTGYIIFTGMRILTALLFSGNISRILKKQKIRSGG
ncbi:MAG: DUF2953 domain-containing protein [Bacillota bacterium]